MLTLLAAVVSLPAVILTLAFAAEVGAGLHPIRQHPHAVRAHSSAAIVVPAHDEAAVVAETLKGLLRELGRRMRVLVVADNCADDTAAIARSLGVEVIERSDATRRGKGFALAFARDHLVVEPPDAVIVIDADCVTDQASLERLASLAVASGRPVQALNLLQPDLAAAPMVQVSNFAFMVKNLVRQTGLARLSGHVHLTGTGMAFPWTSFAVAPLATGDVVEDLGLGLDLSAAGTPPLFAPEASVWSRASSAEGTLRQRTRWEGGFLSTSMRRGPAMMLPALRSGNVQLMWASLSLTIPPLALLVLMNALTAAITAPLVLIGASVIPLLIQIVIGTAASMAVIAAWRRVGRPFLSASAAIRLPLYVLWKLPLYLSLLNRSPATWLRAGR